MLCARRVCYSAADEEISQREAAQQRGAAYTVILVVHVILIIVTLSFFASWHIQVWPYRIAYQNSLELLLFFCNTVVLLMACIYSNTGADSVVLEVAMLAIVAGMALGGFGLFVVQVKVYGAARKRREVQKVQVKLLTDSTDKVVAGLLRSGTIKLLNR